MATTSLDSSQISPDSSQNPTSPYYIHPSDNPGMKFDGHSYNDWKRSMMISLSAKNKMGFVDGTIEKPTATDGNYKAWDRCNNMMISWLLGVLDQDLARSVLYFSTAREIWLNLEERFGQASGTTLFAIHDTKQGSDGISGYFTKMKMLWDQLDSIDPLPSCKCANCTCETTKKLTKSQEDRRLIEFLMKLNEGFEVLRGNILIMSPLPAISHVYRLLIQEENHKKLYQGTCTNEETMAFAVNRRRFQDNQDKYRSQGNFGKQHFGHVETKGKYNNNYYCDHCKMAGHSIQRCYKLNGYPQGYKRMAANLQFENEEKSSTGNDNLQMGFTPSQYQQLLQLLGNEKKSVSDSQNHVEHCANMEGTICLLSSVGSSWIVDSGATDHTCHDLQAFTSYHKIEGHNNSITLPDGKQVSILFHGNVSLGNDIVLKDVLYVPDFKFNLISIPKICKDLQCDVTFTYMGCFL